MSKKAKSSRAAGSSKAKPVAILVIGLVAAVAAALFLSRNATESGTALDLESSGTAVTTDAHVRGPQDAIVTLVEFGDYQCPSCALFHPVIAALMDRFPSQLQFQFRHFPLITIHANAIYAAVAAEAAAEQGAFWEMHDLLFESQSDWASHPDPTSMFASYAERLGLNAAEFEAAVRSDLVRDRVTEDLAEAQQLRLSGTPSFFVNDRPIPLPQNYGEFENYILEAIEDAE